MIMSKQKVSKKLNRLEINKETVRDLDANNAGEVRGGATVNQNQSERIRCDFVNKTAIGNRCENLPSYGQPCQ
jgi:hypothetical protein